MADPAWDVVYDGSVLPTAATPAWTTQTAGPPTVSSDGDILTIDATVHSNDYVYYWHKTAGDNWYDNVDNAVGWTVEARLQIVTGATYLVNLYPDDGTYYGTLQFKADQITLYGVSSQTYDMDTTDAYHIYRITGVGNNFRVYVDEILRITNTDMQTGVANSLQFYGGYSSNTLWDYVKYYTGGAEGFPVADTKSLIARSTILRTGYKNL